MRRSVAFRASCAHHADSTRGERDMRVANVHLRHMLAASIAVTLVSAAPVCAVGVSNVVDGASERRVRLGGGLARCDERI